MCSEFHVIGSVVLTVDDIVIRPPKGDPEIMVASSDLNVTFNRVYDRAPLFGFTDPGINAMQVCRNAVVCSPPDRYLFTQLYVQLSM